MQGADGLLWTVPARTPVRDASWPTVSSPATVSMLMPGTVNPGPYCKFKPPGSGAARFQCLLAKMSRTSRAA